MSLAWDHIQNTMRASERRITREQAKPEPTGLLTNFAAGTSVVKGDHPGVGSGPGRAGPNPGSAQKVFDIGHLCITSGHLVR